MALTRKPKQMRYFGCVLRTRIPATGINAIIAKPPGISSRPALVAL